MDMIIGIIVVVAVIFLIIAAYYRLRDKKIAEADSSCKNIIQHSIAEAQNKNFASAEYYFKQGCEKYKCANFDSAIVDFDEAIKLNPQHAEAYYYCGDIKRLYNKNYKDAITHYDRAIELNPNFVQAYISRGISNSELNKYKEAIRNFDIAIKLSPCDIEIYIHRGYAKCKDRDYEGSIADYDKMMEMNPRHAVAYNNRGCAKYNLDDYEGALADFDKAIEINPEFAEAYYHRGIVKSEYEDKNAIADFEKAIELAPSKYAIVRSPDSGIRSTSVSGRISHYSEVIKIRPEGSADAYYYLSLAKNELGYIESGKKDWEKSKKLSSKYVNKEKVDLALADQGLDEETHYHYKDAMDCYNKAIKVNPYLGIAYEYRGLLSMKLGDPERARADWEKAKRLGYPAPDLKKRVV